MSIDAQETGRYIRQYRKVAGLTQEELARKVGISTMSIRRYENGERIASREMIHAIAAALGEDPFNLMSWDQAAKAIEDDINVGIDARTRLDAAFDRLTGEGKKLVADVAEILASHPNYSQVIEEPPAREGNDTTPPPDAPETPPEGE